MEKNKSGFASKLKQSLKKDNYIWRLVFILLIWMVFMALTKYHQFYTLLNFQTMAAQFPEYGLMSLGVMVCMITGGIDLSTVGIANITSITMALLMQRIAGESDEISLFMVVIVFVLAIIIGMIAGLFNGMLIAKFKIPPILATLGTNELFAGIGIIMTNGKAISDIPKTFAFTINNRIAGIPVQLIVFAVVSIIIAFLLAKTTYGKKLHLLGTSMKVAEYSGMSVKRMLLKTYMISGVCAALGGTIMLANYSSARADYGENYTLQCILIAVLGGVSPNGGKGKISGVILAIILVRMLETGINRFPSVSSYYISLIWGAVLILAMVLDYFSGKKIKFVKKAF